MRVLIAPDKFKGSLEAAEVCNAIEQGIKEYRPDIEVIKFPLADGGDGTANILTQQQGGSFIQKEVNNPLFIPVHASFGISADKKTAFIEVAEASGLKLLKSSERNCMLTSSYGTGELMQKALDFNVQKIVLGIGGSATNDAGMGIANALGYIFYNAHSERLAPIGANLSEVHRIDTTNIHDGLAHLKLTIACDVQNTFFGENGAAYVYAPQKGANPRQVELLDKGLRHFSKILKKHFHKDISQLPGSGAAGGIGGGLAAMMRARLVSGIDLLLETANFNAELERSDIVITGEGKIDKQTLEGKVIQGVTSRAIKLGKPTYAICGKLDATTDMVKQMKLKNVFPIAKSDSEIKEAMTHAHDKVKAAAKYLIESILSE